jgi:hypothetical protein
MTISLVGRTDWEGSQTTEGHREYTINLLVRTTDSDDGPYSIGTSGVLYYPGTIWNFGNDYDIWAYCQPEISIKPVVSGERGYFWEATQKFSTKSKDSKRDQTTPPGNPLLEPPKVSGSFVKYTREAVEDRNGDPIRNSARERFKGASVERDDSRHTVNIEMNIPTLLLDDWRTLMDNVNSTTMWGLAANSVKLSNISWSKKYYGANLASYYYTVKYDFDIMFDSYTRKVLDEGTRTLKTGGDVENPKDYAPYGGTVLLDGAGKAVEADADAYYHSFELYPEANLITELGVPTSL